MKTGVLIIICTILTGLIVLASACQEVQRAKPESYEYTHTTELKRFEIYEPERIKDAERSVVTTLGQLGYGNLTIAGGEEAETPTIKFALPDDATQGPDTWYLMNFHFLVEFEEDSGSGFCDVRAKPGASVQFETLRVNDSPYIRINGQDAASTSTRIEVRYYNYLSLRSVKPGKNEMSFTYKEYQGAKVKSLLIFNDTGLESTTVSPLKSHEERKLTQEEQEKAKELAFSDPRVQAIAEGKEYAIRITKANGIPRPSDEPPDDDIEVRLVFATTYMIEDVQASALDIFVNLDEGKVTYLFPLRTSGMPELTESVKGKVIEIALNDPDVQKLLEGKKYEITRIGICQGGPVGRLGANMDINFDKAYPFKGEFPHSPGDSYYLDSQIKGLEVFVNLKEERVVEIFDMSLPPINGVGK